MHRENDSFGEIESKGQDCVNREEGGENDSFAEIATHQNDGKPRVSPKYRILDKIGGGTMGKVYLAEQLSLKRKVAIKEIANAREIERFRREGQMMAQLRHANIVRVYDIDENHGKCYIVMEYLRGQGLDKATKTGQVDLAEALKITRDIAEALVYAHDKGIIHRDIKPSNIYLDEESGCARLIDFGLAKDTRAVQQSQNVVGTPAYMAPEQIKGRVEPRSDLYSLAAVLYFMITGELPFSGTVHEMLYRIVHDPLELPSQRQAGVPPLFDGLCAKAMAKDPLQRYQDAAEMLAAVNDALAQFATDGITAQWTQEICPHTTELCLYDRIDRVDWRDWRDGTAVMVRHDKGWHLAHTACLLRRKMKKTVKFGGYRILARLNRESSFGRYYLASNDDKSVCVLHHLPVRQAGHRDRSQWRKMLKRVNRGHKIIKALPMVVQPGQIVEVETPQYALYYTMPYVPALNLKQILAERKKLTWQQALPVMYQLANVLAAIHKCRIVHRDLKPAHILCGVDGTVVLAGFAMAKYESQGLTVHGMASVDFAVNTLYAQADYTDSGKALGTLEYMAPEQTYDAVTVDTAADIWSWAVICCEMLCGEKLFGGGSTTDKVKRIRSVDGKDIIQQLPQDTPTMLKRFIAGSLQRDPQQRFRAAEIAGELQKLQR